MSALGMSLLVFGDELFLLVGMSTGD